jgi:FSR family fosmidomycin resistance protein-like MFS transporter
MVSQTTTLQKSQEFEFQTGQVITLSAGHFFHDTYSAFLAILIPELITKLAINLTLAGTLSAIMQLPSLLNPFIGYLDDKINLRLMVILAPAVTATLMSSMGLAPNYPSLVFLLLIVGLSIAAFHATAPALVARTSGNQVGMGMSFFMAAGELGRTVGPLLAVWAFSVWSLEGMYQIAILGWASSLILYWRFRGYTAHPQKNAGLRAMVPAAQRLFIPLSLIVLTRSFLITGLGVYLPTYISEKGATMWMAGTALAIYQLAGVFGAFLGGTMSDRFGRKLVLSIVLTLSTLLTILFLQTEGWPIFPVLIGLGLATLSSQPVMLALVQDQLPEYRSVANGFYMAMSFIAMSISAILVGLLGDQFSLATAFLWTATINLVGVPLILLLPKQTRPAPSHHTI